VDKPAGVSDSRHKAVVLGAGPVGLLGAMALKHHDSTWRVFAEREPNPAADIVRQIGGRYISSLERTIEQMAGDVGEIDLIYEATGASQLAFDV